MQSTMKLVTELKQAEQDQEFYPTTDKMIQVVKKRISENADSIMDIGAGDGRVLLEFSKKCEYAKLYGIEQSSILVQSQPDNIIPVGTEFFEQNLSSLPVDYIFCNPPYSQFEEWICKIISEGFAKKAFVIIPQRWKESKSIKQALKLRGADTNVLFNDDFLNGDRPARAIVDIVEISFPKDRRGNRTADPFDIWFDQNIDTFDKTEPEKESEYELSKQLAKRHANSNIDEMVESYKEEYGRLENNYRAIFKLDYSILKELGIDKENIREGLKKKMSGLKVKYWKLFFDRLDAITSRLSTKSKNKLLSKLTSNTSVEFTVQNAYSVVIWAIKNANQYFDEQLINLFYELSTFEGVKNYKSNTKTWEKDGWRYSAKDDSHTHYSLDYRIVVSRYNAIYKDEDGFGFRKYDFPNNLSKTCHELIADVIAVMSNLGFSTNASSYNTEWESGAWENFYLRDADEILFQVKAYKNGNLHFRFIPDAIKALNVNAGRLLKWVRTEADVVTEMGYTEADAKKYFNRNIKILPSNVKLLTAPLGDDAQA